MNERWGDSARDRAELDAWITREQPEPEDGPLPTAAELDTAAAIREAIDTTMEQNFRMLDENPSHGWRIRLGSALAELEVRMEWFPGNEVTVFWTDSAPCMGVPDSWFDDLIGNDADPRAASLTIAAALIDLRFATWEAADDIDPELETE